MEVLNWGIIKQPMNWFTVILMLLIAGIAMHLILTHLSSFGVGSSPKE